MIRRELRRKQAERVYAPGASTVAYLFLVLLTVNFEESMYQLYASSAFHQGKMKSLIYIANCIELPSGHEHEQGKKEAWNSHTALQSLIHVPPACVRGKEACTAPLRPRSS